MTFHIKTYPDALRQLFIAADPEETNKTLEEGLLIIQKKFTLAGYRKGKVPIDIIAKSNPPELIQIVSDIFLQKGLEYLQSQEIVLYGKPRFHPMGSLSKDKEFVFSLVYEIYPQVSKAPKLENEKFTYKECEVNQEFLEDTLSRQIGLFENITGNIKEGDIVKIQILNPEYKGSKPDASFDSSKLSVLINKSIHDKLSITFDDLSGYLPEFLGKVSDPLQIEIQEISRPKAWNKVTEEEVTQKTPFKTKQEYLESTKHQMEAIAAQYNASQKAEAITNTLSPKITVEIPKSLWLNNLRELTMKTAEKNVIQKEIPIEELKNNNEILSKFSKLPIDSLEGVAFVVWLDEITIKENISINNQDLDLYCSHYAQNHRISLEEFKKNLTTEDKESIRLEIMREKTMTHLISKLEFTASSKIALSEILKENK